MRMISLFMLLHIACGSSTVDRRVDRVLNHPNVEAIYSGLTEIHREHPRNLKALTHLASINLIRGKLSQAEGNINQAKDLIRPRSDPQLIYLVNFIRCDLALRQEHFYEVIEAAELALAANPEDPLNCHLLLARASLNLEYKEKALKSFRTSWQGDNSVFLENDFDGYIHLLMENQLWDDALEVAYALFKRVGYRFGLGVLLSTLHEYAGDIPLSILSAYLDIRYGRMIQGGDTGDISSKLQSLEADLAEQGWTEETSHISAIRAMEHGDWLDAYTNLAGDTIENPVHAFLGLISGFESGAVGYEGVEAYQLLEDYYRNYPEYYYIISRVMRKFPAEFGFAEQRPVLEKVIYQAPLSNMAYESRRQLCVLLLLDEEASQSLFLLHEQEAVIRQFASTGRLEHLYPLVQLLDFESNPYTEAAENALRELIGHPLIRDYLEGLRRESPFRDRRITLLLR